MSTTFYVFLGLIIFVSVLLILAIMVQNPKGGGLSSSFGGGGGQMIGGVQKTGDFLDKSTWTLATLLIVLILLSNISLKGDGAVSDSKLLDDDAIENTIPESTQQPAAPVSNDSTQAQ